MFLPALDIFYIQRRSIAIFVICDLFLVLWQQFFVIILIHQFEVWFDDELIYSVTAPHTLLCIPNITQYIIMFLPIHFRNSLLNSDKYNVHNVQVRVAICETH